MKKTLISIIIICAALTSDAQSIWNLDHLNKVKASLHDPFYAEALSSLMTDAEKALSSRPVAVTDKEAVPTSGDRHDYMSLARYYWPDPSKPDGLPYISRDGESNPELEKYDRNRISELTDRVESLALAWFFSGKEKYAQKATELLNVWFLNPETRMNPNLEYAQMVPGLNGGKGRSYGVLDTYSFVEMLDAVTLLEKSESFAKADSEGLKAWFGELLEWMLASRQGIEESKAANNHGTAYDAQIAAFALYAGRKDIALETMNSFAEKRIFTQIQPDGSQPHELSRTRSWHYCQYNLTHYIDLFMMAEKSELHIDRSVSEDGRSFYKALDFMVPYIGKEAEWPYQQLDGFDAVSRELCEDLYRVAAFLDPSRKDYIEAFRKYGRTAEDDRFRLLYMIPEILPYPQITNVKARQALSLDGVWKAIVDPYENGYYDYRLKPLPDGNSYFADKDFNADRTQLIEYNFDTDRDIMVPCDWNTQDPKLYYYEGTVWYRNVFDYEPKPGKRTFVYFGAANYEAAVGLNGHTVGRHTGGYTPFNFEITGRLAEGDNSLIVKVDNKRHPEGVPTVNSDWWNYGGITRSVMIIETPETFIRDYFIQLKKDSYDSAAGWIQLDGENSEQTVTIEIPELGLKHKIKTDANGYASFEFKMRPELWSPENPKLYDVRITAQTDEIKDRIGFRSISTEGTKILLNGKETFCRGISIHEERPYGNGGRAWSEEHARTLLGWAKEMGCNFVRLAHYPHNETMVRLAEEMGLMVWSEIPVYWTIHWDNPATYANAEAQLADMITRDKNRANVVIWSVANETPHGDARLDFLSSLIRTARVMDRTRLVSAAMEKSSIGKDTQTVDDELADLVDLISFNQYIGWYDGTPEKCDRAEWTFEIQKPVFISEFGGGAVYGRHGSVNERFTEEYLEDLYERSVKMLERVPGLAGTTPWVLKDFRSPRRQLVGIQDDYNRKGLISDQGEKKKAFYVMKRWYEKLKSNNN